MSQPAPREQVGPLPSGGFLLNSGWRINPVGNQVPVSTLPMSTALSPDGKYLLVLNGGYNPPSISVLDIAAEKEVSRTPVAHASQRLASTPQGDSVYLGGGAAASIFAFQHTDIPLPATPTDLGCGRGKVRPTGGGARVVPRLVVTAANANNVYSIGVTAQKELSRLETINVAMTPRHPLGMTPSALALSPDLKRLYIVCSDANAVAVTDISQDRSGVQGFLPTGWYPTAARRRAGGKLAIVSGRGLRSYPNPQGPDPSKKARPRH